MFFIRLLLLYILMPSNVQAQMPPSGTFIYIWSPRMVLSVLHADQAVAAARARQLPITLYHSCDIPDTEVRNSLQALKKKHPVHYALLGTSLPLCHAPFASHLPPLRHYPTAFIQFQQGTFSTPMTGAMPAPYWNYAIKERLPKPP